MAEYYCQPLGYPAYATNPGSTSTAQDGDGLASGIATPAVVSIDLTAYTAAAGATVVVCGVTLTCVTSGATTHQFNAGSGATLAANLVSAINAATNAVNAAATNWSQPQLRNAVYASNSGATLTIQTRAGSATYNSNALWKVVSTGLTGGSQLDATFASGASGAWGYLTNNLATIWPSTVAFNTYGVATGTGANNVPLAGPALASDGSDIVHCRGNSKDIIIDRAASATLPYWRNGIFLFDDGTVWNGDAGLTYITLKPSAAAAATWYLSNLATKCIIAARTQGGLKVRTGGSGATGFAGFGAVNAALSRLLIQNVDFQDLAAPAVQMLLGNTGSQSSVVYRACRYTCDRNTFYSPFSTLGNYASQTLILDKCEFSWPNYSGTPTVLLPLTILTVNTYNVFEVNDCIASTVNPGLQPFSITASGGPFAAAANKFRARNLRGFSLPLAAYGAQSAVSPNNDSEQAMSYVFAQGIGPKKHFRFENPVVLVEWVDGQGWPTLNALLPDGTPWVYRCVWANTAGNLRRQNPTEVLALSKTVTQTAGTRTVALELALDDAYDHLITNSDFFIHVAYLPDDDSGMRVEQTSHVFTGGTALAASSQTWTQYAGSFNGTHVPRKLQLTTSLAVKQNSELEVRLFVARDAGTTQSVFINPELTVT